MKLGILTSHPIQYQAPLFKALAKVMDIHVYFAHRATPQDQARAGFGVEFDWDIDLLEGYPHTFLQNISKHPNPSRFSGCDTPDIESHIAKEKFDAFIVMGWHLKCYWQAVRACHRYKIPVLVRGDSQLATERALWKRVIKRLFYPFLLRQFDGFLVVGKRFREYLRFYGVPERKMFDCPHFIDNDRFWKDSRMTEEDRANRRRSLGLDPALPLLLFVGKFIPRKHPLDFISALDLLEKKAIYVQAMFVGSGELEIKMRRAIEASGISAKIVGFVNQKELPKYYGISDLLILPSDAKETWGLVVNEAMACGIPAIVSNAVGCSVDLVDSGKTGMTYPFRNIEDLAKAIEIFLSFLKRNPGIIQQKLKIKIGFFSLDAALKGVQTALDSLVKIK